MYGDAAYSVATKNSRSSFRGSRGREGLVPAGPGQRWRAAVASVSPAVSWRPSPCGRPCGSAAREPRTSVPDPTSGPACESLAHLDAVAFDERFALGLSLILASLGTRVDVANSTPGQKGH